MAGYSAYLIRRIGRNYLRLRRKIVKVPADDWEPEFLMRGLCYYSAATVESEPTCAYADLVLPPLFRLLTSLLSFDIRLGRFLLIGHSLELAA